MSVQEVAKQLEAFLNGLADKQGGAAIDEQVALAQACFEHLTAVHDAALADAVKPAANLATTLAQFPEQNAKLNEKRYAQLLKNGHRTSSH